MKKKILLLLVILLIPLNVKAATGSIKVSASNSKVTLNNNFTVTVTVSSSDTLGSWQFNLNYDKKKLSIQSGQNDLSVADVSKDGSYKTTKYTYKFKAIALGDANISIENAKIGDWTTDSYISTSTNNINVTIKEPVVINYSSDNNLKNLSVEGFSLSPEFNKSTLEYTSTVTANTTKINLQAMPNDSKAKISGTGEKDVVEGNNSFQIIVKAENGSSKTYTVNVIVPEKDPIKYDFNNKTYSILRKLPENTPKDFSHNTIKINAEEVPCLQNETLNLTLLYLKDQNEKDSFYIYDSVKNTITLYNELYSYNFGIYLTNPDHDLNLFKTTIKINDQEIKAYQIKEGSKNYIIYGRELKTGKGHYYIYDKEIETLSFFNEEDLESLKNDNNIYKIISYSAGVLIILLLIIIILQASSKKKMNLLINKMNEELTSLKTIKEESSKNKVKKEKK